MTKRSEQKFKYFKNEKSFFSEINNIFIIFKGLSVIRNSLRPESAPLKSIRTIIPSKLYHAKHEDIKISEFFLLILKICIF